jgi:hypothetical protein
MYSKEYTRSAEKHPRQPPWFSFDGRFPLRLLPGSRFVQMNVQVSCHLKIYDSNSAAKKININGNYYCKYEHKRT